MLDPCKHCQLYREEVCAHVDGYLCKVESCEMLIQWLQQKENLID